MPATVSGLVQALGIADSHPQFGQIQTLAKELQHNLMPAGDRLYFSHYYLKHWNRQLKAGPSWAVTLMRDNGYQHSERGQLRNRIQVDDGFGELARLLQVTPETFQVWLPKNQPVVQSAESVSYKKDKRERLRTFLTYHRDQLVVKTYDPLIPEHEHLIAALEKDIWQAKQTSSSENLSPWLEMLAEICPDDVVGQKVQGLSDKRYKAVRTKGTRVVGQSARGTGQKVQGPSDKTREGQDKRINGTDKAREVSDKRYTGSDKTRDFKDGF